MVVSFRSQPAFLPNVACAARKPCQSARIGTGLSSIARPTAASSLAFPTLGILAAYGENEKDAVAHVAELASEHERYVCS